MENYTVVTRAFGAKRRAVGPWRGSSWPNCEKYPALPPFGGKGESHAYKAESDHHIPGAHARHRVTCRGHIKDYDPDETSEKSSDHYRGEPSWALLGKGYRVKDVSRNDLLCLFAELGFRHSRG